MEIENFDIVNLIEQNSNIKLSNNYQNKLLNRIQEKFTEQQQKIFISSFFGYLNYNQYTDFVVDFDSIWKWLGYSRKDPAKVVLEKHFTINIDYKIFTNKSYEVKTAPQVAGTKNTNNLYEHRGGYNKEKILMTINTFKKFCLKSNTKKADEIHDYFIKLEECLQETVIEESTELKTQLQEQKRLFIEQTVQTEIDKKILLNKTQLEKEILLEKTLLQQFPVNTQCIYLGIIDNKDANDCNLSSFGMSNDLNTRIKQHKKIYTNFRLIAVFKVKNHIEIENYIKKHQILKQRIRYLTINNINYREHLNIDPDKKDPLFSVEKIYEYIKEIIEESEYNIENYNKLTTKCNELELKVKTLELDNKNFIKEIEELNKFKPTSSNEEKLLKKHNKSETSGGYIIYAFLTNIKDRYKLAMCKKASIDNREMILKLSDDNGSMKLKHEIKHPFLEKTLMFLVKRHLVMLNNDTFDGSIEDIKLILHIISIMENLLINNDLENIQKILDGQKIEFVQNDPEIPHVKKSKRSIDQINKDSGKIIATYPSIEEAGRKMNLTTGTAIGIALRNRSLSCGFLWRHSGISADLQMKDQKVIRINCDTGERKNYPNIASSARDAKVTAPCIRNRVITDVHINGYHWIFDKTASHYN